MLLEWELHKALYPQHPKYCQDNLSVLLNECVKVVQSCPTLCDPPDYTVCGILQATILEWVAFPFSRGSSQPFLEFHSLPLQGLGPGPSSSEKKKTWHPPPLTFGSCFLPILIWIIQCPTAIAYARFPVDKLNEHHSTLPYKNVVEHAIWVEMSALLLAAMTAFSGLKLKPLCFLLRWLHPDK